MASVSSWRKWFFDDPQAISVLDEHDTEERWVTIGMVAGALILVVAHATEEQQHEQIIRIISARKATPSEREAYSGARA